MTGSSTATSRHPTGIEAHSASGPRFFAHPPREAWRLGDRILDVSRPRVMGILNLTPDSFSDGGQLDSLDDALHRAAGMVEDGADILDVGGESTRPGAREVPVDVEIGRILPFLEAASSRFDVPLSVDTRKAAVARAAVDAGAAVINDVSGLTHDPEMAPWLAGTAVGVVLMHMRGTPETMTGLTSYSDVVEDVRAELGQRVGRAREAGITPDRIVVDPGIGFAKDAGQSLELLRETRRIADLGFPVMVGPSRKSFLGAVLGTPPEDRVEGTLAACAAAYHGGARIFRVHDVAPVVRLLGVLEAVERGRPADGGEDR